MALPEDPYMTWGVQLDSPAGKIVAVTPSDTTDLPDGVCRALLVASAGTVKLSDKYGNAVANVPLVAGYNFLRVSRVWTGGSTGAIFALY